MHQFRAVFGTDGADGTEAMVPWPFLWPTISEDLCLFIPVTLFMNDLAIWRFGDLAIWRFGDLAILSRVVAFQVDLHAVERVGIHLWPLFQISFSACHGFRYGRISKIAYQMQCLTVLFSRTVGTRRVALRLEIFPYSGRV